MKRLACIFLTTGFLASATAALAPGTVDKMKQKAEEVVRIEITERSKGKREGENRKVHYGAKVVEVIRSKAGLKKGQEIRVESYIRSGLGIPMPGPMPPSYHDKGWKGTVWLNGAGDGKNFRIAVYGHSFEAD